MWSMWSGEKERGAVVVGNINRRKRHSIETDEVRTLFPIFS
jgi:hypothetical protein